MAGWRELAAIDVTVEEFADAEVQIDLPPVGSIRVSVDRTTAGILDLVAQGVDAVGAERSMDGSFWFRDLKPGTYLVRFRTEQHGHSVQVNPGEVVELDLEAPAMEPLTGIVLGTDDLPVPDAWIVVRGRGALLSAQNVQALTNAKGTFEVLNLHQGEYDVLVETAVGNYDFVVHTGGLARLRVPPTTLAMGQELIR